MIDAWALNGRLTSVVGQFGEAIENSPVLITLTSGNDNYRTKYGGNFRQMIVSTG